MPDLWWLDTGWACGGIYVEEGFIVRGGAPIFRKLIGQTLPSVLRRNRRYRAVKVH